MVVKTAQAGLQDSYPGGYYPFVSKGIFRLEADPQVFGTKVEKSLHTNPDASKNKLEKLLSDYIADLLGYKNVQIKIIDAPNIIVFEPQTIKIENDSFRSVSFGIDPKFQAELAQALANPQQESNLIEELKGILGLMDKEIELSISSLPVDLQKILDDSVNQTKLLYEYLRMLFDLQNNNSGGAVADSTESNDEESFTLPDFSLENINPHAKIKEKRNELIELLGENLVRTLEKCFRFDIEDLETASWMKLPELNVDLLYKALIYIQNKK